MNHVSDLKSVVMRRMWLIFLVFIVSGVVGVGVGFTVGVFIGSCLDLGAHYYLVTGKVFAVSIAVFTAFFVGKKLTTLVDRNMKLSCSMCSDAELDELHTLQCQPVQYECKHCNSLYRDGRLVKKN